MLKIFEKIWSQYRIEEALLLAEVSLMDLLLSGGQDAERLVNAYQEENEDALLSEASALDLLMWASEK